MNFALFSLNRIFAAKKVRVIANRDINFNFSGFFSGGVRGFSPDACFISNNKTG